MTWRDKSCEHCVFRVDKVCRRFPPITTKIDNQTRTAHPLVIVNKKYIPACSEYAQSLDKPLETITEEV